MQVSCLRPSCLHRAIHLTSKCVTWVSIGCLFYELACELTSDCIKIINVIWGQIIPKKFTNAVTASGRNTFQERSAKVLQTLLQLLADLDAERLCLSRSQDGEFNLFPPPAPSWQHPGRHRYAGEPQPNCYRGEFCTHLREILNSSQMPPH